MRHILGLRFCLHETPIRLRAAVDSFGPQKVNTPYRREEKDPCRQQRPRSIPL